MLNLKHTCFGASFLLLVVEIQNEITQQKKKKTRKAKQKKNKT